MTARLVGKSIHSFPREVAIFLMLGPKVELLQAHLSISKSYLVIFFKRIICVSSTMAPFLDSGRDPIW